jgi:hypothetical protein
MGTKGSYSGAGGAAGTALREGVDDWLASLPGASDADSMPAQPSADPTTERRPGQRTLPPVTTAKVLPAIGLFRSSSPGGGADGPGGGGGRAGNGLQRSDVASAGAAGRGAAAAYAYRIGDADALRELGLDYAELRANPDVFDVANRITQAVCDDLPAGVIEADELLIVVGDLCGWVLEAGTENDPPQPQEIAREALSRILAGAYLTETAAKFNGAGLSRQERAATEDEIRAACEELAAQADLPAAGPTSREFTTAIETGLSYLRIIYEGGL